MARLGPGRKGNELVAIVVAGMPPPGGDTDSIRLETRAGTRIPNIQDRTLPPERLLAAVAVRKKYVTGASQLVNGPSGFYNCAGLALAVRRTQIIQLAQLPTILIEDGYVEIFNEMSAKIGDLVTYWDANRCDHMGIVIREATGLELPRVLSKFGWSIEVAHYAHQCPYDYCSRRYFRIRNYDLPNEQ